MYNVENILEKSEPEVQSFYKPGVLPLISFPILSDEYKLDGASLWLQQDSPETPVAYHIRPPEGAEITIPYSLSETFFIAKDFVRKASSSTVLPSHKNTSPSKAGDESIYGLMPQVQKKLDYYQRGLNIDLFSECFAIDEDFAYYIFHDDYMDSDLPDGTPCLYWDTEGRASSDSEAGWHISITSLPEELSLGYARYDDRAGIKALVESLKDPEALLVRLALTYPEEAEELASAFLLRDLKAQDRLPDINLNDLRDSLIKNNLGSSNALAKNSKSGGLDSIVLRFDRTATIAGVMIRIPETHNIVGHRNQIKRSFSDASRRLYSAKELYQMSELERKFMNEIAERENEEYRKKYAEKNPHLQNVVADRLAWQEKFEKMIDSSDYNIVYKKEHREYNGCDYIVSAYEVEVWDTLGKQIKAAIDDNPPYLWPKDSTF